MMIKYYVSYTYPKGYGWVAVNLNERITSDNIPLELKRKVEEYSNEKDITIVKWKEICEFD